MKKTLHYLDRITKEHLITREVDTAFYGTNIPNTTEGELLPFKNGFARCFYSNKCEYVEDNRTKDIHNTETKENSICDYLGALKSGFALGEYIKTVQELESEQKESTENSLMLLCDSTQSKIEKLLLGYKATSMQIARYKDKYERAINGEFETNKNSLIISNHEMYQTSMRKLIDLIEYFRSEVDDLIIAGEFDKANKAITSAESFNATTTLEDIKKLLVEL